MQLDRAHDAPLVAEIVGEWADIHQEPFELKLTGSAGGTFSRGTGCEDIGMDALDFIRTLAGRLPGSGVMCHPLPL